MAARVWDHKFVMEVKAALIEADYKVEYKPTIGTIEAFMDEKSVFTAIQKGCSGYGPWICRIEPGLIEDVN